MEAFTRITSQAHVTGAVSADHLAGRLAEIDRMLDELKNDAMPARRRVIAARLSAAARGFAQSVVIRSDGLDRLARLADQLECLPTSMQRFDHQVRKLEWALRHLNTAQLELVQQEAAIVLAEPANDEAALASDWPHLHEVADKLPMPTPSADIAWVRAS